MAITKAQIVSTIEEVNKKFKMEPLLKTTGTIKTLEGIIKTEIIPELEEEDSFTEETQEVIDSLMDVKSDKEEKKGKKGKKEKKEKKETPEKEVKTTKKEKVKKEKKGKKEEAPAKEAKEAKEEAPAKEVSVDTTLLELAISIKENKKMTKAEMLDMVKTNPAFKAKKKELKKVKSVFSLKKLMLDMLPAIIPAKPKVAPKAKAKAKKANPLVKEINEAKKLKVLKKVLKANSDAFKGIKAKKFDDADELRKVMLKAVGGKAEKKKAVKGITRVEAAALCVLNAKKNETAESIIERADKMVMKENEGVKSQLVQTGYDYRRAVKIIAIVNDWNAKQ